MTREPAGLQGCLLYFYCCVSCLSSLGSFLMRCFSFVFLAPSPFIFQGVFRVGVWLSCHLSIIGRSCRICIRVFLYVGHVAGCWRGKVGQDNYGYEGFSKHYQSHWIRHGYTGGQEKMMSKVVCAIFGNLHSLPFIPLSPLWCNFQSKTGTEPLTSSFPGPLQYGKQI